MKATCPDCGNTYGGVRQHCRGGEYLGCCRTFNSTAAGDMHRLGHFASPGRPNTRRCMTVAEMLAAGMSEHNGIWYGPGREPIPGPVGAPTAGEQDPARTPVTPQDFDSEKAHGVEVYEEGDLWGWRCLEPGCDYEVTGYETWDLADEDAIDHYRRTGTEETP